MGADIKIRSIAEPAYEINNPMFIVACDARDKAGTDKEKEKFQADVDKFYDLMNPDDGYFRDSYNGSNMLWKFGMSWWTDVAQFLDGDNMMSVENMQVFKTMLENAIMVGITREYLEKEGCIVDGGENSAKSWAESFEQERKKLLLLLQRAIELNEPIHCSI